MVFELTGIKDATLAKQLENFLDTLSASLWKRQERANPFS